MDNLVSIVVPIYNMGDSIEICVESLLKQSYKNLEIILVDDGSTDNSLEICNKIKESDHRVKVFHTENRGSGPARNTGILNSTGRYIYFPDADDKLKQNAISVFVEAMTNENNDLIVSGCSSLNSKGMEVLKKSYPDLILSGEKIRNDYSKHMGASTKL